MPAVKSFAKCQVACILLDPRRAAVLFTGFATCTPLSGTCWMRQTSHLPQLFLQTSRKRWDPWTERHYFHCRGTTTQLSCVDSAHIWSEAWQRSDTLLSLRDFCSPHADTVQEPLHHFLLPPDSSCSCFLASLVLRLLLSLSAARYLRGWPQGVAKSLLACRGFKPTNLLCSSLNWGMPVHEQLQELSESRLWAV